MDRKDSTELSKYRVLIADDNELELEIIEETVRDIGVECDTATDGQAVLDKLTAAPKGFYNLVLTDIFMPRMNGIELVSAFRASSHPEAGTLPFIGISADNDPELFDRAANAGLNGMTNKPVSRRALEAYFTLLITEGTANAAFAARMRTRLGELSRTEQEHAMATEALKSKADKPHLSRAVRVMVTTAVSLFIIAWIFVAHCAFGPGSNAFTAVASILLFVISLTLVAVIDYRGSSGERNLIDIIRRERDAAINAERAKTYFFATVSHDIRTPLNSIIGFAELLKFNKNSEEEKAHCIDAIISSGRQLVGIVNDVLDLSKLEADKMVFEYEPADPRKIAAEVVLSLQPLARDTGIELKLMEGPNTEMLPLLDPVRFRQVLTNIASNAVKVTEKGGVYIDVTSSEKDRQVVVNVRDTGPGISPQNIDKLMQPFVQLSNTNRSQGTGLGLAIARQMVEKMGGNITIKSTVGKGSTFTITLNKVKFVKQKQEKPAPAAAEPQGDETVNLSSLRVLLVDDLAMNLMVLARLLKLIGITQTISVKSGAAALVELEAKKFDVVLTDLRMPEMSGEELVSVIRNKAEWASLPVFAITADADIVKRHEGCGFNGYLVKPVTADSLRTLLAPYAAK